MEAWAGGAQNSREPLTLLLLQHSGFCTSLSFAVMLPTVGMQSERGPEACTEIFTLCPTQPEAKVQSPRGALRVRAVGGVPCKPAQGNLD